MHMGRERDVLRWDIHASLLRDAIALAADELAGLERVPSPTPRERDRARHLASQLDDLERRLRALGPSPRAKMG
jgi:hypothetical protein